MSVNPISPDVFQGGQMTDLPAFSGTLDGRELLEVVASPAGQTLEAAGVNYKITSALLAALLTQLGFASVILVDGQHSTPGDPLVVNPLIGRVYINKAIAEPTYIMFGAASTYFVEPLVKDIAGTVDVGSEIHVAFSGAEQADGNATVTIGTPYGGYFFRPIAAISDWTLGSA